MALDLTGTGTLQVWNLQANGQVSSTVGFTTAGVVNAGIAQVGNLALTVPLPASSGGTGTNSFPAGTILVGNGTGAATTVAASTSYNTLVSDGTTWTSAQLIGGTWTACGNRSQGVNYTNDTGKWMQVCGNYGCNGGGQGYIYINGALIAFWQAQFNGCGGYSVNMPCLVPPGATYQLANMGGGFRSWYELR